MRTLKNPHQFNFSLRYERRVVPGASGSNPLLKSLMILVVYTSSSGVHFPLRTGALGSSWLLVSGGGGGGAAGSSEGTSAVAFVSGDGTGCHPPPTPSVDGVAPAADVKISSFMTLGVVLLSACPPATSASGGEASELSSPRDRTTADR